jgi:hypothetical protein
MSPAASILVLLIAFGCHGPVNTSGLHTLQAR